LITKVPLTQLTSHEQFETHPEFGEMQFKADFCQKVLKDVEKNGFINPLLVSTPKNNKYRILVGHNRFLIAKHLKLESIDCIILNLKQSDCNALADAKKKYYQQTDAQ